MSERELSSALERSGRRLPLGTIREWRVAGLLPDAESRSLGARKGKICFWSDEGIHERARLVFDLRKSGVRKHRIVWILWLCGMHMPLASVRRAWLQDARTPKRWKVREKKATAGRAGSMKLVSAFPTAKRVRNGSAEAPTDLLLHAAFTACSSLACSDDPEIDALVEAMDAVMAAENRSKPSDATAGELRQRVVAAVKVVWSSIKTSDLIAVASDAELLEAQRYTATALRRLEGFVRQEDRTCGFLENGTAWPVEGSERFGAPLFFLALLMLRAGQRAQLDLALRAVERAQTAPDQGWRQPAIACVATAAVHFN